MRQMVSQTDVRRASSFNAPTYIGAGHNKSVTMCIDPRYDALCASRLRVAGDHLCCATSVKYLGVLPDASIFRCLIDHIK